jgi:peptidoglycan-associated lipoprotein
MISTRRIAGATTAVLTVVAISACHHSQPASTPAPVMQAAGPNADSLARAQADAARRAAEDAARRRAADSAAAAANAARNRANAGALATTLTAMVHFEYDQADLRPGDRAILDAKVPILQANSGVMIRVAGHTDERGSDEYNLALGQRRAAAVKAYLVQRGIAEGRIATASYGEEHPIAQGNDESAWSQNRRAEFDITSGGNNLRSP